MINILADIHHWDLFYSFYLLFEKRLGFKLYRPIGLDWLESGYWALSSVPEVNTITLSTKSGEARSILQPYWGYRDPLWARNSTEILRIGEIKQDVTGIYSIQDLSKDDYWQHGITFEQFKQTNFDFIISSVPQHFNLFEQLCKNFQPKAKHILHYGYGNIPWPIPDFAKNIMCHVPIIQNLNTVIYHQEFDLSIFSFSSPEEHQKINSYVHFPISETLAKEVDLNVKFIGKTLDSLDKTILGSKNLARIIKDSAFTWHIKPGGESYGHILHNSLACGRPLIINAEDFKDIPSSKLLTDGQTCINITGKTSQKIKSEVQKCMQPEEHNRMCENAYQRFKNTINFDEDEQKVRKFIENIL